MLLSVFFIHDEENPIMSQNLVLNSDYMKFFSMQNSLMRRSVSNLNKYLWKKNWLQSFTSTSIFGFPSQSHYQFRQLSLSYSLSLFVSPSLSLSFLHTGMHTHTHSRKHVRLHTDKTKIFKTKPEILSQCRFEVSFSFPPRFFFSLSSCTSAHSLFLYISYFTLLLFFYLSFSLIIYHNLSRACSHVHTQIYKHTHTTHSKNTRKTPIPNIMNRCQFF